MINRRKIVRYDFVLFFLIISLVICGILFIYSSNVDTNSNLRTNEYVRQIIWALSGIVFLIFFSLFDYRILRVLAFYSYLASIIALLFVLFFGKEVNGARSWIGIGSLGIQPSELAKITTILYLAAYMERNAENIHSIPVLTRAGLITFVPFLLVILQPDLGTALVYLPIFLVISFVAGAKLNHLLFLSLVGLMSVLSLIIPEWLAVRALSNNQPLPLLAKNNLVILTLFLNALVVLAISHVGWHKLRKDYFYWIRYVSAIMCLSILISYLLKSVLKEYQLMRLIIFLDPFLDPQGAGWNVIQSLNAVGSGGFLGKGFLQGYHSHSSYLPQQSTDFIFSILSEEWGFAGGVAIFALFFFVIYRGINITIRAGDNNWFGVLIGTGIVTVILTHFTINVGMAMGIMPVTGIPLLFLSHGGSSLWSAMIMIGILMSIHFYKEHLG